MEKILPMKSEVASPTPPVGPPVPNEEIRPMKIFIEGL